MALSSKLSVQFSARQTGANDVSPQDFAPKMARILEFANGVGANQANLLFADAERSIAASGNDDIDLAGVLTDAFGATITAAEIVAIIIFAKSTNTNNVVVGPGAVAAEFTGPWSADGTISIGPGGMFVIAAPGAAGLGTVTATSADILRISNSSSGSAVLYDIAILARNA